VGSNPTLSARKRNDDEETIERRNDLQFRKPKNAVIYDTELFYAIILKSVGASEDDCDVFVPESERLAGSGIIPRSQGFLLPVSRSRDTVLYEHQFETQNHGRLCRLDISRGQTSVGNSQSQREISLALTSDGCAPVSMAHDLYRRKRWMTKSWLSRNRGEHSNMAA
jgi:hypothetical protein